MRVVIEVIRQSEADGVQWLSVVQPAGGQEGIEVVLQVLQCLLQQVVTHLVSHMLPEKSNRSHIFLSIHFHGTEISNIHTHTTVKA